MSIKLTKGYETEEILRNYFLGLGFYVVRGIKFKYKNFDVTDIDLLIFSKESPLIRTRINVDIKNKKTPQAIERFFWAQGVSKILGLDDCLIVTSENRADVLDFGLKHHIRVLDGSFLTRLYKSNKSQSVRITEETLFSNLDIASNNKIGGDWKGKIEKGKSRLIDNISFDSCNAYLKDLKYFFECSLGLSTELQASISLWRAIYITTSHFLISLDYILREYQTCEHEKRKAVLDLGFKFGNSGKDFTEKVGSIISALAESVIPNSNLKNSLECEFKKLSDSIKSEILAEYFSRPNVNNSLFEMAKQFESFAYQDNIPSPSTLPASSQSVIALLCDFYDLERKKIIF
ncbi:hypothetical protein [Yersinia enterocolitica]|uniref:hypothetical protein n=1 Tax=Yersinia enterocolitica TaxID=630 RepID=UPI003DAF1AEB